MNGLEPADTFAELWAEAWDRLLTIEDLMEGTGVVVDATARRLEAAGREAYTTILRLEQREVC